MNLIGRLMAKEGIKSAIRCWLSTSTIKVFYHEIFMDIKTYRLLLL